MEYNDNYLAQSLNSINSSISMNDNLQKVSI
jgi:hypothetical protein